MTKLDCGYVFDGMNESERNVKRIVDFFIAAICLVLFSPLFLICYILVKREDGGSAIFKQERIGRFGRPFYIYKFRSMRLDAEKNGPALYQHERDTRMTKIGRFLRVHHLDEPAEFTTRSQFVVKEQINQRLAPWTNSPSAISITKSLMSTFLL